MYSNKFSDTAQSLTENDLRDIEQAIGYELPSALRQHYLIYNGGEPERRYFITADGRECEIADFNP